MFYRMKTDIVCYAMRIQNIVKKETGLMARAHLLFINISDVTQSNIVVT